MMTERLAVVPLRVFLVVLFGVLVMLQTFSLPGQFAYMARESPDLAYLRWPFTAMAVFWVLCAQVVVVCTWRLLTLVTDDRIFSPASLAWVDAIVGAVGAAWLLLVAVFLFVGFQADDPGLPLLLFLLVVGGAVFGLLLVVMRALLRQAAPILDELSRKE